MSTIPFSPKQKPDESTLTDRQRKVLDAIRTHIDEQGFAPSFREIGNAAGLKSPSSVKHQLQVLEDKGFIRMNANKGRAIEVVAGSAPNAEKPSQASEEATSTSNVAEIYQFPAEAIAESHDVPLVGRIAAGVPITAEQHVDDVMRLPERLTGSGDNLFMLEVHGDSMVDAAICDGDYRGGARTEFRRQRRYRRRSAGRRGHGEDLPQGKRPCLADAAQPRLLAHRRHTMPRLWARWSPCCANCSLFATS